MPEILSIQEVDDLLKQPDLATPKGIRDKAMLELLYATGMRVSELIHLEVSDVNLQFGYVVCQENKERIIPIGNVSKDALKLYLDKGRSVFVKDEAEEASVYQLFRESYEPSGLLEDAERICRRGWNTKRYYTSYTPSFFCSTYAPERC